MIEKTIYDYLNGTNGISSDAYLTRPETAPESYVLIEKTGSSTANHIDRATIAVQSFGPTLYAAASLNDEVKRVMADIIELDEISSCRCATDYNFTNIQNKQPRYQALFDIVYMEQGE